MIRAIAAENAWLLRRDVLNPTRSLPTTLDPLDAIPRALHLGWLEADQIVGVGTISRYTLPLEPGATASFVHAMAVSPDRRLHGIFGGLLRGPLDHALARDQDGVDCG